MNKVPKWIIDTDAGIDDAQAMAVFFRNHNLGNISVQALTVSFGNVTLEHAVRNTCTVADLWGCSDIPVYSGASGPFVIPHGHDASLWHGEDGLGGLGFSQGNVCKQLVKDVHAALGIVNVTRKLFATGEKVNICTLGPLTNLALAIKLFPDLPSLVGRVVVMGGAYKAVGNASSAAEFNIFADPDAAFVVFDKMDGIELVTWELTLENGLSTDFLIKWLGEKVDCTEPLEGLYTHTEEKAIDPDLPLSDLIDNIETAPIDILDVTQRTAGSKEKFLLGITHYGLNIVKKHRILTSKIDSYYIPDPLAAVIAVAPDSCVKFESAPVTVELAGTNTRGMTVVDWRNFSNKTLKTKIITKIDMDVVRAQLLGTLV